MNKITFQKKSKTMNLGINQSQTNYGAIITELFGRHFYSEPQPAGSVWVDGCRFSMEQCLQAAEQKGVDCSAPYVVYDLRRREIDKTHHTTGRVLFVDKTSAENYAQTRRELLNSSNDNGEYVETCVFPQRRVTPRPIVMTPF